MPGERESPHGSTVGASHSKLYLVTGAPGTGKSAILRGLDGLIRRVPEPARAILAEQRASGGDGVPDRNPSRFVDLLLRRSIQTYDEVRASDEQVLFDRGIPDCAAYAEQLGVDPLPSLREASTRRYHPIVLVARPWEAIYTTDEERRMSFAATLEFQRRIERAYERAGYALEEIPRGSLEERVRFVRAWVSARSSR